MNKTNKKIFKTAILVACVIVWGIMIVTDYYQTTHNFEKPVFAIWTKKIKDGGSGTYTGVGYSIEIEGNFMPEDELPGVTHVRFSIFGNLAKESIRD